MEITEVRIKLAGDQNQHKDERLCAFASITIDDCFVVGNLKIIYNEKNDQYFVAMPSHKLTGHCLSYSSDTLFRFFISSELLECL